MVNVFGNMVKKLKDEKFIKSVSESMPPEPEITPEFMESYNQYQKRAAERKKKGKELQPI
ncbi:hypothetical protein [Lysinibacillus sphaericus]|uniref:hypothetical protein n=1 Tax=Lysinibacillus sphaericus TaxID=1421 RepID=UPI002DBED570|nr:hypothetical protein [Lysinibacillus sphaericus]MEB7455154.1 hypothetical protein [Lysinibacillus sphaericus]